MLRGNRAQVPVLSAVILVFVVGVVSSEEIPPGGVPRPDPIPEAIWNLVPPEHRQTVHQYGGAYYLSNTTLTGSKEYYSSIMVGGVGYSYGWGEYAHAEASATAVFYAGAGASAWATKMLSWNWVYLDPNYPTAPEAYGLVDVKGTIKLTSNAEVAQYPGGANATAGGGISDTEGSTNSSAELQSSSSMVGQPDPKVQPTSHAPLTKFIRHGDDWNYSARADASAMAGGYAYGFGLVHAKATSTVTFELYTFAGHHMVFNPPP